MTVKDDGRSRKVERLFLVLDTDQYRQAEQREVKRRIATSTFMRLLHSNCSNAILRLECDRRACCDGLVTPCATTHLSPCRINFFASGEAPRCATGGKRATHELSQSIWFGFFDGTGLAISSAQRLLIIEIAYRDLAYIVVQEAVMTGSVQRLMAAVVALGLVWGSASPGAGQTPPAAASSSSERLAKHAEMLLACERSGDVGAALTPLFTKVYAEQVTEGVVATAIDEQWNKQSGDAFLLAQFRATGEDAIKNASWGEIGNSFTESGRKQFTDKLIASTMGRSDVEKFFTGLSQHAMERVSGNVAKALEGSGSDDLRACFKAQVQTKYQSPGLARFALQSVGSLQNSLPQTSATTSVSPLDVTSGAAVAGLIAIVMRRQIQKILLGRISGYIGRFIASAIAKALTGLGIILVLYDVWSFRNGMLPAIVEAFQKPEVMATIRQAVKDETLKVMRSESEKIGSAAASDINSGWLQFRSAHNATVNMMKHERFKAFVDELGENVKFERVTRAVEIAGGKGETHNQMAVLKALEGEGVLLRAVVNLDELGLDISRDLGSLSAGLLWQEKAKAHLQRIVTLGLHKQLRIEDETAESIDGLLSFKSDAVISKLVRQKRAVRDYFIGLPRDRAMMSLISLEEHELAGIGEYIGKLDARAQGIFTQRLLQDVGAFRQTFNPNAAAVVLGSRDQALALSSVSYNGSNIFVQLWSDIGSVSAGHVSWRLLWLKHPIILGVGILLALLPILQIAQLIWGRRSKIILVDKSQASSTPPIKSN